MIIRSLFILLISAIVIFRLEASERANLKILATTDLHGHMLNYDYYQDKEIKGIGLNRLAHIINKMREVKNSNVLLLDNGDLIQGNPFADYAMGIDFKKHKHPMIKVMEYLKFDVMNLGNHEFNYGLVKLDKVLGQTKIPIVNANIYDKGGIKNKYRRYVILEKEIHDSEGGVSTIKIGITGVTPPQIMDWDKSHLEGKITVKEIVKEVRAVVRELRERKVDIIIVLSHSGIGNSSENAVLDIAKIEGINFIVSGHDHGVFPKVENPVYKDSKEIDNKNGTINGIPVVMAGAYGSHLGLFDIDLEKGTEGWIIKSVDTRLLQTDESDDNIDKLIANEQKQARKYINTKIGSVDSKIANYFVFLRDDFSIELVNKAQIDYVSKIFLKDHPQYKDLAVISATGVYKNGGRGGVNAYTVVDKGDLTIRSVSDLYAFSNTLVVLKINGKELREWLEWSAQAYNKLDGNKRDINIINSNFRSYNFDIIDGISYKINIAKDSRYKDFVVTNKDHYRIEDLKHNDINIKDSDEFLVATSNYRANMNILINKDNKNILLDSGIENKKIVIDYIKDTKNIINIVDNNWQLTFDRGTGGVFIAPAVAREDIAEDGRVEYIKDIENGFALYRVVR